MGPYEKKFRAIVGASEGYIALGMHQEAWDELETLEPEARAHPDALALRLEIFVALKRYESAAILAEGMIANGDDTPGTWLHGAWAIRRHRTLEDARAFLLRGEAHLENVALFQYNLACYECQLGNMLGAKVRLTRAFELDPALRATALDDEDLWPIW